MATLIHDCPYCNAKSMTFTAVHGAKNPSQGNDWNVLLVCAGCGKAVIAFVNDKGTGRDPTKQQTDLRRADQFGGFIVLGIEPRPVPDEIPDHLPPAVAKAFKEGCEVLKVSADASYGMFRKALELGLKDLSPEVDAYKLHKRIDLMADKGLLTKSLQEWSHHLRLDANEMIHEGTQSDKDHALEIQNFTKFVLTYLFTLPESVRLARPPEAA